MAQQNKMHTQKEVEGRNNKGKKVSKKQVEGLNFLRDRKFISCPHRAE